jgi:hypothetical protein
VEPGEAVPCPQLLGCIVNQMDSVQIHEWYFYYIHLDISLPSALKSHGLIQLLGRNLPGRTEEIHEEPQSGHQYPGQTLLLVFLTLQRWSTLLRNVSNVLPECMEWHARRWYWRGMSCLWDPEDGVSHCEAEGTSKDTLIHWWKFCNAYSVILQAVNQNTSTCASKFSPVRASSFTLF